MSSTYPAALDNLSTAFADDTQMAAVHPSIHNDLSDAVNKVERALGINPSGGSADVATAIAANASAIAANTTAMAAKVDKDSVAAAATRVVQNMLAGGDTQPAWRVLGSGRMEWGQGGTTAPDLTLYRQSAGILALGTTTQPGRFRLYGTATWNTVLENYVGTEAQPRLIWNAAGQMTFGDGVSAPDAMLFRSGPAQLSLGWSGQKTSLRVFGGASTDTIIEGWSSPDTAARWYVRADGQMQWGPGNAAADTKLYRVAANILQTDGALVATNGFNAAAVPSTGIYALQVSVTGDSQVRLAVRADGYILWGTGAAPTDTFLSRGAAGRINVGHTAGRGYLHAFASVAADNVFQSVVTTDAQPRFSIGADGKQQWGDGTAAQDTTLARGAAGRLHLGTTTQKGALRAFGSGVSDNAYEALVTTDSNPRWYVTAVGFMGWGNGAFGADTNLYRSTADWLKTDDLFDATVLGLATKAKAGAPVDADWAVAPPVGTIVLDTTGSKLWIRTAAATWKGVVIA